MDINNQWKKVFIARKTADGSGHHRPDTTEAKQAVAGFLAWIVR